MIKMKLSLHAMLMMVILMIMCMDGVIGFKEFRVGGRSHGWKILEKNDTDHFFNRWASKKRFHVGDVLVFQFQNDSLLIVDKYGYYHCDPSKATNTYTDGNTIVKLEHPGFIYFISGKADRCLDGLRMVVEVMSHHRAPDAPTPTANSPEATEHAEAPGPLAGANNSGSHLAIARALSFLGLFIAIVSVSF